MRAKKNGQLGALLAAGGLWVWENRDKVRELLKSEQVAQVLKTPQAQRVLSSAAAGRMLNSPELRAVINHPEVQRWLNSQPEQASQPPQSAQDAAQEPYTGETRRL
jgi:hypothetical protein